MALHPWGDEDGAFDEEIFSGDEGVNAVASFMPPPPDEDEFPAPLVELPVAQAAEPLAAVTPKEVTPLDALHTGAKRTNSMAEAVAWKRRRIIGKRPQVNEVEPVAALKIPHRRAPNAENMAAGSRPLYDQSYYRYADVLSAPVDWHFLEAEWPEKVGASGISSYRGNIIGGSNVGSM